MSKKANVKYKYAIIQYGSREKCKDTDYIVICSEWIATKKKGKTFYWPGKNWLSNKQAVKNCEKVDCGTWSVAPIKTIVHYSNDLYDAVLYTITLRSFNINAFKINDLKKVHDQVYEFLDCPDCSKWLHETTASLTCEDVIESKLVTDSPAWSSPQSPPAVIKLPQDQQSDFQSDLLSDRLCTKKNTSSTASNKYTDDPMSPSLLDSYFENRQNLRKRPHPSSSLSIKKLSQDKQRNLDRNSSPSSADNKSTDDPMSPSLLDSYFETRRNVRKRPHPSSSLSIKKLYQDKQSNFDRNSSPISLYINGKSATSTDNTMSPSMLDFFYMKRRNCPKTMSVCIRLENKFDEM